MITEPIALVQGEPWIDCPKDLYIPVDAMRVFLDGFTGPLDLLLYLIKRENFDILNIPIVTITAQYMEYVDLMQNLHLELAADYLVMAALLAEIKSRMLLPKPKSTVEIEADPRANLVQKLQEYAAFKLAAQNLDALPRLERDNFIAQAALPDLRISRSPPLITLTDIFSALQEVIRREQLFHRHTIAKETISLQDRIASVMQAISNRHVIPFASLFSSEEGRMGVVVTFMAILELLKIGIIDLSQTDNYELVHIKAKLVENNRL